MTAFVKELRAVIEKLLEFGTYFDEINDVGSSIRIDKRGAEEAIEVVKKCSAVVATAVASKTTHWRTAKKLTPVLEDLEEIRRFLSLTLVQLESADPSRVKEDNPGARLVPLALFGRGIVLAWADRLDALARYYERKLGIANVAPKIEGVRSAKTEAAAASTDSSSGEVDASEYDIQPIEFQRVQGILPSKRGAYARLVPVFFATDRKVDSTKADSERAEFLNGIGAGKLTYGLADVSIPPVHVSGKMERPLRIWKYELFEESIDKHVVVRNCRIRDEEDWNRLAVDQLSAFPGRSALVFIHGFNVSLDEGLRRAAQIGHDIRFPGLISAFSWSSEANAELYQADGDHVMAAVPLLQKFLVKLRTDLGINEVHVIAHSMGNRALLHALALHPNGSPHLVDEVVMAAPDVSASEFRSYVPKIIGKAARYTLYGSQYDVALSISAKWHGGHPRAGEGGLNVLVAPPIDTVDVSITGREMFGFGHSYVGSAVTVLGDLWSILRNRTPIRNRPLLEPQGNGSDEYWVLLAA